MNTNAAGGFPHVILASASPRRLDLLRQAGIEPEVEPSHVVEVIRSTKPDEVVMELSRQKAEDIASRHTGEDVVVIGADTVVAFDGNILGKPKDEADAVRMIASFQGKAHQVYTGVTLVFCGKAGERPDDRWKTHYLCGKNGRVCLPHDRGTDQGLCKDRGANGQGRSLRHSGAFCGLGEGNFRGLQQCGGTSVRPCMPGIAGDFLSRFHFGNPYQNDTRRCYD